MKTFIVESQAIIAVVGVSNSDGPIRAVAKFLKRQGLTDLEIGTRTTLYAKDEYSGTWESGILKGTYVWRSLII